MLLALYVGCKSLWNWNNPNKNKNLFFSLGLNKKIDFKLFDIRNNKKLISYINKTKPLNIISFSCTTPHFGSYKNLT